MKPLPVDDLEHVLRHTRQLWAEAQGQTFFITGGTGFFGMWLLESFAHANDALNLGMRALVLTRDPVVFTCKAPHLTSRADLEFIAGDVRNFAFPPARFTHVIHAATDTRSPPPGSDPKQIRDDIVAGTRRVLEFARHTGAKKFLYVSSGAVYGPQPADLTHVPEDYFGPTGPLTLGSAYGAGKRLSEELCGKFAAASDLQCKIARCFAFVGPHLPLDAHFAVGNFIRDALAGGPIKVNGDGTPMRSYLYAADLAIWLWTILFLGQSGRAYNVGSDAAEQISAHAYLVNNLADGKASVLLAQPTDPNKPASRYVPAIDLARNELDLDVWIQEEDGIRRTLAWHGLNRGAFSSQ
ncbi:MAG: NAD(P)-dependent oxidoreductase [Cephaloticoccus sp.]|nr:NAD(P)-dependent oxidoreductase [Cephaloticoccus sp.]